MYYSVSDFLAVKSAQAYVTSLDAETIEVVANLNTVINGLFAEQASTGINLKSHHSAPYSKTNTARKFQRPLAVAGGGAPDSAGVWAAKTPFKLTKIDKKQGVEKDINDLRVLLNKISPKNVDTQSDLIIASIHTICDVNDTKENDDDLRKVAQHVFEIASSNKFYSKLYAELYQKLVHNFDMFAAILNDFITNYKNTIDVINYIDPNLDYDGYCTYNKINDKRKATASFIIMLLNIGLVEHESVVGIIDYFVDVSLQFIDTPSKLNEVDEITENIFIFITTGHPVLRTIPSWHTQVCPKLMLISKMKAADHASLSSRVIFKYMDILKLIT